MTDHRLAVRPTLQQTAGHDLGVTQEVQPCQIRLTL